MRPSDKQTVERERERERQCECVCERVAISTRTDRRTQIAHLRLVETGRKVNSAVRLKTGSTQRGSESKLRLESIGLSQSACSLSLSLSASALCTLAPHIVVKLHLITVNRKFFNTCTLT